MLLRMLSLTMPMQSYDRATSHLRLLGLGGFGLMPGITGPAESHTQVLEQVPWRDTWEVAINSHVRDFKLGLKLATCGSIFKKLDYAAKATPSFHFPYPRETSNEMQHEIQHRIALIYFGLFGYDHLDWCGLWNPTLQSFGWVWSLSLLLRRTTPSPLAFLYFGTEEFPTQSLDSHFSDGGITQGVKSAAAINLLTSPQLTSLGAFAHGFSRVAFGLENGQPESQFENCLRKKNLEGNCNSILAHYRSKTASTPTTGLLSTEWKSKRNSEICSRSSFLHRPAVLQPLGACYKRRISL